MESIYQFKLDFFYRFYKKILLFEYFSSSKLFIDFVKVDLIAKNHSSILHKICGHCNYHTSLTHYKKEKLVPKPKPERIKPVLEVWKSMTVSELVNVSQRSMDDILDALYFADPSNNYQPNSIIHNNQVLFNAIKKLGVKCKMKNQQVNKQEDQNVYKR